MSSVNFSFAAQPGGQSVRISVGAASVQTAVITRPSIVITPDVAVYLRRGVNPVALADGTDQYLLASQSYRLHGFMPGERLALIAVGAAGLAYITPDAG